MKSRQDAKRYWDRRAMKLRNYKGEEFYTITDIPFYVYRRNRTLEILNSSDFEGRKVLEIGCGDGYYSRYLTAKGADVTGVDISRKMIELAKKKSRSANLEISFHTMDGEHLEFEDNSFDFILAVTVLQHVLSDRAMKTLLCEASRVLGWQGMMVIFERTNTRTRRVYNNCIVRTSDEYVSIFQESKFKLQSYALLRSPFHRLMIFPFNIMKARFPIPDKVEFTYSSISVAITKRLDKTCTYGRGLGYYLFQNRKESDKLHND